MRSFGGGLVFSELPERAEEIRLRPPRTSLPGRGLSALGRGEASRGAVVVPEMVFGGGGISAGPATGVRSVLHPGGGSIASPARSGTVSDGRVVPVRSKRSQKFEQRVWGMMADPGPYDGGFHPCAVRCRFPGSVIADHFTTAEIVCGPPTLNGPRRPCGTR